MKLYLPGRPPVHYGPWWNHSNRNTGWKSKSGRKMILSPDSLAEDVMALNSLFTVFHRTYRGLAPRTDAACTDFFKRASGRHIHFHPFGNPAFQKKILRRDGSANHRNHSDNSISCHSGTYDPISRHRHIACPDSSDHLRPVSDFAEYDHRPFGNSSRIRWSGGSTWHEQMGKAEKLWIGFTICGYHFRNPHSIRHDHRHRPQWHPLIGAGGLRFFHITRYRPQWQCSHSYRCGVIRIYPRLFLVTASIYWSMSH